MSLATQWVGIQGGAGVPQAQNQTINAFNSSGSNSRAGFTVQRDGDVLEQQGQVNTDIGDYVASGLPDANIGLLYEVRVIQSSGDSLTNDAGLNVWLQISGNRTWDFNDSPGVFADFVGTWEVREIANVLNTSGVKSVDLHTEDGS